MSHTQHVRHEVSTRVLLLESYNSAWAWRKCNLKKRFSVFCDSILSITEVHTTHTLVSHNQITLRTSPNVT